MRSPITLEMDMIDLVLTMAEGNPGALKVIMSLLTMNEIGVIRLLSLDDMNIRGSQIWIAYKDHCGEDIEKLIEEIENRSYTMVETVNMNSGSAEVAVCHGGSYRGRTR